MTWSASLCCSNVVVVVVECIGGVDCVIKASVAGWWQTISAAQTSATKKNLVEMDIRLSWDSTDVYFASLVQLLLSFCSTTGALLTNCR